MNKMQLISFFAALIVTSCMQAMDLLDRITNSIDEKQARADVNLLFCEDNACELVQPFYESKHGESYIYKHTILKRMLILGSTGTTAQAIAYIKQQIDILDPTKKHIQFSDAKKLLASYILYYSYALKERPEKELEDFVEWCIARKAPITQDTHTSTSPLTHAIAARRPALVKLLLAKPGVNAQHQYIDATPPCTPISYVESLIQTDEASNELLEIREALYIAAGIPLIDLPAHNAQNNPPGHHFKAAKLFGVVCVLAAVVGGIAYWWNQKTDKNSEEKPAETNEAPQVSE